MKNKGVEEFEEVRILSREDMLKILSELIIKIKNKIFYGRFNKYEIEKLRISYDRLLCNILETYDKILKNAEFEKAKFEHHDVFVEDVEDYEDIDDKMI